MLGSGWIAASRFALGTGPSLLSEAGREQTLESDWIRSLRGSRVDLKEFRTVGSCGSIISTPQSSVFGGYILYFFCVLQSSDLKKNIETLLKQHLLLIDDGWVIHLTFKYAFI